MSIAAAQAFYEATAQILPILLLVIAVDEARFKRRDEAERLREAIPIFVVSTLLVVVGEATALRVLITGEDSTAHHWLCAAALSFGFAYLAMALTRAVLSEFSDDPSTETRRQQRWLIGLCGLATLLPTYALLVVNV